MAFDMFLEFPDPAVAGSVSIKVTGESQDAAHRATIEVQSMSSGVQNPVVLGSGAGGAGAGKAKFDALQLTKSVDQASPLLMKVLVTGAHFPEASIFVRKAGAAADYLVYRLGDVFVTDLKWSADTGNDTLVETVELAFGALQVMYTPQTTSGGSGTKAVTTWNQVTNNDTFETPAVEAATA